MGGQTCADMGREEKGRGWGVICLVESDRVLEGERRVEGMKWLC